MVDKTKALASLAVLFASFQGGKPIAPELASEIVRPLLSYPDEVFDRAITNFRAGNVPGMDMHFPPAIPEIVRECRRLMPTPTPPPMLPEPGPNKAELKRLGKKMVGLASQLDRRTQEQKAAELRARTDRWRGYNSYWDERDPRSQQERMADLMGSLDRKTAGA